MRKRLRAAKSYQVGRFYMILQSCPLTATKEWKDAALALDDYLKFDTWKTIDEDPYYDWKLVRKVCIA